MKLSSRAHELFEAFKLDGCPVCRLVLDSVYHYLDSVIYEYVNKPATHEAVRAARGFCPTHAWRIQHEINASALGVAVLYEGIVRHMLKDMGDITPQSNRRQVMQAASALEPRQECPACTHQRIVEEHLLRNLVDYLDQPGFAGAFRETDGICLPHLRQALEMGGNPAGKAHLVSIQQDIWTQLQQHLAEFRRKRDYQYADEDMGEEGSSPRRAIEGTVGLSGIR
ncbi:MAG: hypothetical protein GYB65_05140 [Chloroflexi bacterium]|nr:hypothetical protein [Chloroflexota bacterium]